MRTAGYLARLRSHRWWVAGYLTTACLLSVLLFIVGTASSGPTGLNRRVFPDVGFAGTPVLADVSTEITLDFLDDYPELPRRFFSARWHGFWYLPESGDITFYAAGDDRLDIRLDGELLIRRTPPTDMHTATRDVTLDAGVHEIVVEYQQHGGASALGVRWQPRGGVPRGLPAHRLFPRKPEPGIDPGRFRWTALLGSAGTFFSIPSVFVSFPIVNLGAASAVSDWLRNGRRLDPAILQGAAAYNATVLGAYLLLRTRSNAYLQDYWADGFMPLNSTAAMADFLANNGVRLLDASLPAWGSGPETVSWMLAFVGLGLGWLLARDETRFFGLIAVGFFAARIVASALWIYPLGASRVDIFSFPVTICLFATGIHAATASFPKAATIKLAAATVAVAVALAHPVNAEYLDTGDVPLVEVVSSVARPNDGMILSQAGVFLTAFYGPWSVATSAADDISHGTAVTLVRDRTLHLPMNGSQARLVTEFLDTVQPARVWYVAYRTRGWEDDVLAAMSRLGYFVSNWRETAAGRLYLGLRRTPHDAPAAASTEASSTVSPEPED